MGLFLRGSASISLLSSKKDNGEWQIGDTRTLKTLNESAKQYALNGKGNRKNLQKFYNVEYPPIIEDKNENAEIHVISVAG